MTQINASDIAYLDNNIYELFTSDMSVPAHIVADETCKEDVSRDRSLQQTANVAQLPGIQPYVWAMPDMHEGYGFPIGGVAATTCENGGVISPGGIGYDINCGVRLLRTNLSPHTLNTKKATIAQRLQQAVPSGLGGAGSMPLSKQQLQRILAEGPQALHTWGYGQQEDIIRCESSGIMQEADPACVSQKALLRGKDQLGTLGSGNHFLEMQCVSEIYDEATAHAFGLEMDMVVIMIHCGSRGLGHQVCTDYVRQMVNKQDDWGIDLPDPELACAPIASRLGSQYYAAMSAAANFAWANRHAITHAVRSTLNDMFHGHVTIDTVYDICHNIGKKETHTVDGQPHSLLVHRKGATRAFSPHSQDTPQIYQDTGHPVLIPGTMGTSSFIMAGHPDNPAFASCCHGAGRVMSRRKAREYIDAQQLRNTLEHYNVHVVSASQRGFIEEAPQAYKDVVNVVNTVSRAQLACPVARTVPRIVIKG